MSINYLSGLFSPFMLRLQEQDGFANPTTVTETWEISALETELSLDNQANCKLPEKESKTIIVTV